MGTIAIVGASNPGSRREAEELECHAIVERRYIMRQLACEVARHFGEQPDTAETSANFLGTGSKAEGTGDSTPAREGDNPNQLLTHIISSMQQLTPREERDLFSYLAEQLTPARRVEFMVKLLDDSSQSERARFARRVLEQLDPKIKQELIGIPQGEPQELASRPVIGSIQLELIPDSYQATRINELTSLYKRAVRWVLRQLGTTTKPTMKALQEQYYGRIVREFPDLNSQHVSRVMGLVLEVWNHHKKSPGKLHPVEEGTVAVFDSRSLRFLPETTQVSLTLPPRTAERTRVTYRETEFTTHLPKTPTGKVILRTNGGYWLKVPVE